MSSPVNSYGPLGANLTLDCEARGYPAPTITWQFVSTEGKTISLPSRSMLWATNYNLIQLNSGIDFYFNIFLQVMISMLRFRCEVDLSHWWWLVGCKSCPWIQVTSELITALQRMPLVKYILWQQSECTKMRSCDQFASLKSFNTGVLRLQQWIQYHTMNYENRAFSMYCIGIYEYFNSAKRIVI